MRILIDLQGAQTESRFRGIGRYSMALVEAIIKNNSQHEIWILLNGDMENSCLALLKKFSENIPENHLAVFYPPQRAVNHHFSPWLKRAAEITREHFIKTISPDILFITSLFEGASDDNAVLSIGLLKASYSTVSSFYDLIPLLNPENYLSEPVFKQWYMDKIESLKQADLLLSISDYSKQEVEQALLIDSTKVINISSACNDFFKPISVDESRKQVLFKKLGIFKPFLMTNSAFEHRKNIDRLIRAFACLEVDLRNSYQLLLTGKVSEHEQYRLICLAKSLRIEQQVLFSGYLEDDELLILYNCAHLFVFPSTHEGFGLPALEAMSCGAPTIGSSNTSIPEVIGLSEALFDPYDVASMKNKITEVLISEDFRQKLIQHGLMQAKKFSWDSTAKSALEAFDALHNKKVSHQKHFDLNNIGLWYQVQIEYLAAIPKTFGIPSDLDLKILSKSLVKNQKQLNQLFNGVGLPQKIRWRVEGPFDSSYSLALLNRETSIALSALGHEVYLHSTDGPGDFDPQPNFLKNNPKPAMFYEASKSQYSFDNDVVSRNLYPPRVNDMDSKLNLLHHYAWEESGFPQDWVEDFNEYLQGITCLSSHAQKIMIDNGVTVPLVVSGCGVDHWDRILADYSYKVSAKPFRFLHVSSCFPRKGADALLKAFGIAFSINDPVTLVIKTFTNPHNEIHSYLADLKKQYTNYPDVLIIEEDLSEGQLKKLYQECDVLVAPSRAEGFGLPMAEAMLSGMSVITTGWGGQLDFCNEKTAWLVDYEFKLSNSHFGLFDSVWAEPNVQRLSRVMVDLYHLPKSRLDLKVKAGQKHLRKHFTWQQVTQRLVNAARDWANFQSLAAQNRIAWVTTWNTPCGIATYSKHLIREMSGQVMIFAANAGDVNEEDGSNVRRCWQSGLADSLDELSIALDDADPNCVVVQFNYGLFKVTSLEELLISQLNQGRVVVLMMHSTLDPVHLMPGQQLRRIRKTLGRCQRILVHSVADLNRLKAIGLVDNATLFPHGILDLNENDDAMHQNNLNMDRTIILASYGFFLPHKGLLELIQVTGRLIEMGYRVQLKMINAQYPMKDSAELVIRAKKMIDTLNLNNYIQMITDYLSDEQSIELLKAADLLIYPYQETGESASGAVRYGLALGKPVMVTPLSIFDDVSEVVYKLPGLSLDEMTEGVKQMIDEIITGGHTLNNKRNKLKIWQQQHLYSVVGKKLNNILNALLHQKNDLYSK